MENDISYLVIETTTGAVNGWYDGIENAEIGKSNMVERYPHGKWIILKSAYSGEYGPLGAMYHNEPKAQELLKALK